MKTSLLILASLAPLAATANTLYKCIDDSGVVLYTNQKSNKKNCTVLSQQMAAPPSQGNSTARPRPVTTPTPGDFPRVSGQEQKARDSDRRVILDKELINEQQLADKARKDLLDASSLAPDKLQPLRDTLALHERNIESLKKELGKLR